MYYETKAGDDELRQRYDLSQKDDDEEDNDDDAEEEEKEPKVKKQRKTRRSEASMLEQDNVEHQLVPSRPKRASGRSDQLTYISDDCSS